MSDLSQDRQNINQVIGIKDKVDNLQAENAKLKKVLKEFVLAAPDCCWRRCWGCKKVQIHRESVTPGVLCRFCGSQDTRLLREETQALKGNEIPF